MKFDSKERIQEYFNTGKYPSIHDDIFMIIPKGSNAIDLGCCYGFISKRLIDYGYSHVTAIDGNDSYLSLSIRDGRISYRNYYVNSSTLEQFSRDLDGVDVIVARRVFPEISACESSDFVRNLSELFYRKGVTYIVIEGRKIVKRPTNELSSLELEVECFLNYYSVDCKYKNCIRLKIK